MAYESMDEVVQQWGDALVRLAYGYLADSAEAQDIAQEAMFRYYQQWERKGHSPSIGWLYTVTRHLAIDEQRRRRHTVLMTQIPEPRPSEVEGRVEEQLDVRTIRESLAPLDQVCLWLFYDEDYSLRDIAQLLHKTPASVRVRLVRARKRFAQKWKGDSQYVTEP